MIRIGALSVVPSPYQRDLFSALAAHPEVNLEVFYQSPDSVDNPWPEADLHDFESLLSGRRISYGTKRAYVNWSLPDFRTYDLAILNTSYVSSAAQWLMRARFDDVPWIFWGERMREQTSPVKRVIQDKLAAPLARANAIACIGSLAVDSYRDAFPNQTLFNIPYYCALSDYARAAQSHPLKPEGERITLLFCGQMIRRKGVDLLIRAFDRIVRAGHDVELVLIGREAELPTFLLDTTAATRDRVRFLGFQDPDDLPDLFAQADIFVLPSRHDGWGVVVNEALGSGLPLVCSDAVGAAHDLIHAGKNGVRIPAGEVDPLHEALEMLITDAEKRSQWGQASADLRETWTPAAGAQRWVDAAQTVLDKQPASSS